MTLLTSCTIGGTAIPTASDAVTLEKLLLWSACNYYKLFNAVTYQPVEFVERLTFAQKAIYRRADVAQDVLVFTLHFPMQSSAIVGQVDWDQDTTAQGRWMYATQPTSDTALAIPTAYRTIKS